MHHKLYFRVKKQKYRSTSLPEHPIGRERLEWIPDDHDPPPPVSRDVILPQAVGQAVEGGVVDLGPGQTVLNMKRLSCALRLF